MIEAKYHFIITKRESKEYRRINKIHIYIHTQPTFVPKNPQATQNPRPFPQRSSPRLAIWRRALGNNNTGRPSLSLAATSTQTCLPAYLPAHPPACPPARPPHLLSVSRPSLADSPTRLIIRGARGPPEVAKASCKRCRFAETRAPTRPGY